MWTACGSVTERPIEDSNRMVTSEAIVSACTTAARSAED